MNPTQNYHSAITHLGSSDIETVLLRVERGECNGDDANLLRNYIHALEARLADYEHDCLYWGGLGTAIPNPNLPLAKVRK
jgi:hypothetical protein